MSLKVFIIVTDTADTVSDTASSRVVTFGCRLNLHESAEMAALGAGQGNTIVVNTCAVTTASERQARQAIRRLHRENPDAEIIVTGCASEIAPDRFGTLPGVKRIIKNSEKTSADAWKAIAPARPQVLASSRHIRAFLQVQQGCDHRCTFCIIPYGRGNSRSFPVDEVVSKARKLVASGHHELVVTGVDIASWGVDLFDRPALGKLCQNILSKVPELRRLRLSSIDPAAIDDTLWALIADEPRLLPHLHLSLQAADNLVLKRMKRRHSREDVARLILRARSLRPGIAFGADLIAGFPTETDQQAQSTYDFLRDHEIPYVHAFPYSERPGTPAARMPAVAPEIRSARAARLRELGEDNRGKYWSGLIGEVTELLMETDNVGRSPHFAPVKLARGRSRRGEMIMARLIGLDNDKIVAEIEAHG